MGTNDEIGELSNLGINNCKTVKKFLDSKIPARISLGEGMEEP